MCYSVNDNDLLPRRAAVKTVGMALAGAGLAGCTGKNAGGNGRSSGTEGGTEAGPGGSDPANGSARDGTATDGEYRTRRRTYALMEGTKYETTVYVLESAAAGPTAVVLGGVHGNETGGVNAAHVATEYTVGRGTVVVLPETNRPAVEAGSRQGPDGDLNRQFPVGEGPTSELANAVWDLLREHEPDAVIDMHSSKGVYQLHDVGVGQVVFPHGGHRAITDARAVTERVNDQYLAERLGHDLPAGYAFRTVSGGHEHSEEFASEADRMLVPTAATELDLNGWITEVTFRGFDLEEQTFLHDRLTAALLERSAVPIQSPLDGTENPLLDN